MKKDPVAAATRRLALSLAVRDRMGLLKGTAQAVVSFALTLSILMLIQLYLSPSMSPLKGAPGAAAGVLAVTAFLHARESLKTARSLAEMKASPFTALPCPDGRIVVSGYVEIAGVHRLRRITFPAASLAWFDRIPSATTAPATVAVAAAFAAAVEGAATATARDTVCPCCGEAVGTGEASCPECGTGTGDPDAAKPKSTSLGTRSRH